MYMIYENKFMIKSKNKKLDTRRRRRRRNKMDNL